MARKISKCDFENQGKGLLQNKHFADEVKESDDKMCWRYGV